MQDHFGILNNLISLTSIRDPKIAQKNFKLPKTNYLAENNYLKNDINYKLAYLNALIGFLINRIS